MVCPRCIQAVRTIFYDMKISIKEIELGEVWINVELKEREKLELKSRLNEVGFELLDDTKKQLIEKIKTSLINLIQHSESELNVSYSQFLSDTIGRDYRYLSSLFSALNGITIEKYIIQLRVEKIKEYIFYDELTISEIAYKMHYSSPAHLSRQFKQVCGLSPKEYKKQMNHIRKSLDQV